MKRHVRIGVLRYCMGLKLENYTVLEILDTVQDRTKVIKIEGNKYILKTKYKPLNFWEKLKSSIFRDGFYFESKVYGAIKQTKTINVPELEYIDENYIVLQYLEGAHRFSISDSTSETDQKLSREVFELNRLDVKFVEKSFKAKYLSLVYSLSFDCLRSSYILLKDKVLTIRDIYFISRLIFELSKKQKKIGSFLMHNDFLGQNNLLFKEGNFYLIDFENVTIEEKWILKDIVSLAFDLNTLELRTELINQYVRQLPKDVVHKLDFENQIRLLTIVTLLQIYRRNIAPIDNLEQKKHKTDIFIKKLEIVYHEDNFKQWYHKKF